MMEVDPPIYTYGQMLNRVVDLLHQNNPDMLEKRKYTMKPPQLMRGTLVLCILKQIARVCAMTARLQECVSALLPPPPPRVNNKNQLTFLCLVSHPA